MYCLRRRGESLNATGSVEEPILVAVRFRSDREKAGQSTASTEGTANFVSCVLQVAQSVATYQEKDGRDDSPNFAHVVACLSLGNACYTLDHSDDAFSDNDEGEQLQSLN
jgi:hypothetical protein